MKTERLFIEPEEFRIGDIVQTKENNNYYIILEIFTTFFHAHRRGVRVLYPCCGTIKRWDFTDYRRNPRKRNVIRTIL